MHFTFSNQFIVLKSSRAFPYVHGIAFKNIFLCEIKLFVFLSRRIYPLRKDNPFRCVVNGYISNKNSDKGLPGGSNGKEFTCNARDLGSIPGFDLLPGESPWAEQPGGLQPMGSQSQTGLSD